MSLARCRVFLFCSRECAEPRLNVQPWFRSPPRLAERSSAEPSPTGDAGLRSRRHQRNGPPLSGALGRHDITSIGRAIGQAQAKMAWEPMYRAQSEKEGIVSARIPAADQVYAPARSNRREYAEIMRLVSPGNRRQPLLSVTPGQAAQKHPGET
jgi:hypothetical protein